MANNLVSLSFANVKFNNRLAYLLNTLSVIILIGCAINYSIRHWFTVDKILIEGDLQHVTAIQLSYVAHNKLHGTFFTLNIGELKSEFQALPWVRKVSVQRHFPHTVMVKLEEYTAVARVSDDDLIASDGRIFDGADNNVNLPMFYLSNSDTSIALTKYQQIQAVLSRHNDEVTKLWLTLPRITKFETKHNLYVTICEVDLTAKLAELDQYWDRLYRLNPGLTSVNLCYKNALAIN